MVGFQQLLDKSINDTKVYNFTSIIQRVRGEESFPK
jgi:hypothetical protein